MALETTETAHRVGSNGQSRHDRAHDPVADSAHGRRHPECTGREAITGTIHLEPPNPETCHGTIDRGGPESVGTGLTTAHQVDVVSFLWASMALFDNGATRLDTGVVYRPSWHDLHGPLEARQRIRAMLASLPEGAAFECFLPEADVEQRISAHASLRRRSAWATAMLTAEPSDAHALITG